MGRCLKGRATLTVYQGLAVLALGLFASRTQIPLAEKAAVPEPTPSPVIDSGGPHVLQGLYKRLQDNEWFKARVEGVRLWRTPHRVVISIENDGLYEDQSTTVSESWMPLIDGLARVLLPELGTSLQVRIEGFVEDRDEAQGVSVFTQLSDYRLATERASWLVDHLERNFPESRKLKIRIGAGVASSAERVEIHVEMR
jgi:flagellar motor protein MotB